MGLAGGIEGVRGLGGLGAGGGFGLGFGRGVGFGRGLGFGGGLLGGGLLGAVAAEFDDPGFLDASEGDGLLAVFVGVGGRLGGMGVVDGVQD